MLIVAKQNIFRHYLLLKQLYKIGPKAQFHGSAYCGGIRCLLTAHRIVYLTGTVSTEYLFIRRAHFVASDVLGFVVNHVSLLAFILPTSGPNFMELLISTKSS